MLKRRIEEDRSESVTDKLQLALENKKAPETLKFVFFSQEEFRHYKDTLVRVFLYNYINCTTEVKITQTDAEWMQYMQVENDRLREDKEELMDVDKKYKFEGVMFQFMGQVGDLLLTSDANAEDLKLLDQVVDEILPKHNTRAVFAIGKPEYQAQPKGSTRTMQQGVRRGGGGAARRTAGADNESFRPATMGFSVGQNSMVTKTFLSVEGLKQAVRRGEALGFENYPEYLVMLEQLQWCDLHKIQEFTVDDVLYLSHKNMRMHMDRDEIEKAMLAGKVYMVMAGMKESNPGEGGKIIIPFKMIRKDDTNTMEIPTYDSHSVDLKVDMLAKNNLLEMEEGSVNFLVHFSSADVHANKDMLLLGSTPLLPGVAPGNFPILNLYAL